MKNCKTQALCETCKYFVRHYAEFNGKFCKIGCGHCSNVLTARFHQQKEKNVRML